MDNTSDDPLRNLAEQVDQYTRQAEELGSLLVGHRLLECPQCGLAEDALADLTVRVVHPDHPEQDTGLRFEPLDDVSRTWTCPHCGAVFEPEEPLEA
jgi:hypothetical protein